jgi:hypothetical protein
MWVIFFSLAEGYQEIPAVLGGVLCGMLYDGLFSL